MQYTDQLGAALPQPTDLALPATGHLSAPLQLISKIQAQFDRFLNPLAGKCCAATPSIRMETDPAMEIAGRAGWSVMAFQTIFTERKPLTLPGPGNGYYEAVQFALNMAESLAGTSFPDIDLCDNETDHFLASLFNWHREQYNEAFSAVLYFIALRLVQDSNENNADGLQTDFWHISMAPRKETIAAAREFIGHSNSLFHSLAFKYREDFKEAFPLFLDNYRGFAHALIAESKEKSYCWCPGLTIQLLRKQIPRYRHYPARLAEVERLITLMEANPTDLISYLKSCLDAGLILETEIKTKLIALKFFRLAEVTYDLMAAIFVEEIKILKLP